MSLGLVKGTSEKHSLRGYSLQTLADQYSVSVGFLRKIIRRKELKSTKLGSKVIILAEDWEQYLAKNNAG